MARISISELSGAYKSKRNRSSRTFGKRLADISHRLDGVFPQLLSPVEGTVKSSFFDAMVDCPCPRASVAALQATIARSGEQVLVVLDMFQDALVDEGQVTVQPVNDALFFEAGGFFF